MRTFRIGLLVATALVILMVTILSLGQEQRFWERRVQYEVRFARAGGLQKGAPVSLTGVTVGAVDDMRFPPEPDARYSQVLINVRQDAAPRIREDCVAAIRTYGLLGDRYIELSGGTPQAPPMPADRSTCRRIRASCARWSGTPARARSRSTSTAARPSPTTSTAPRRS